jgi:hypothetical protein
MEIANAVEPMYGGILIELLYGPFMYDYKGAASAEYGAALSSRSRVDGSGNQCGIFRLCHSNHSRIEPPHLDRPRMAANKITAVRTWAGGITANKLFEPPGGTLGGSFSQENGRPKRRSPHGRTLGF